MSAARPLSFRNSTSKQTRHTTDRTDVTRWPFRDHLEVDSRAASRIERTSWCRAPILAVARKRRDDQHRTLRPPSLTMLKSEDNRPGAPSGTPRKVLVWCRARLAKLNVQTNTWRAARAANASSLYLAVVRSCTLRPYAPPPNLRKHATSCETPSFGSLRPPLG
jgi:hypothetical protein